MLLDHLRVHRDRHDMLDNRPLHWHTCQAQREHGHMRMKCVALHDKQDNLHQELLEFYLNLVFPPYDAFLLVDGIDAHKSKSNKEIIC